MLPIDDLALDLRWAWDHSADKLWRELDPVAWQLTRNPWAILQTISREKLEKTLANPTYKKILDRFLENSEKDEKTEKWFQKNYKETPLTSVAYFSMEYMLSEALPIYSGGLGNVAGDQLKAASDLGVPVTAVGLLYQQGYFRQVVDKDGKQHAYYPFNDPDQLPIRPVRRENGEWLRIEVPLPGYNLWLRAWEAKVGRLKLYLLDSNDLANYPPNRGLTNELYRGDSETRIRQEMILGIAGWQLLEELGLQPEVCHLNEGHAAFLVLSRAASFMRKTGKSFAEALAVTRAGNHFTTHTAVPAGFDRFSPELMERYVGNYFLEKLKIPLKELLALGRKNPEDSGEYFNMAYLAVRGSSSVNGVSKLHGEVSRELFSPLFPRWPVDEIPIGYITNGVHVPSWDGPASDALMTEFLGERCWTKSDDLADKIRKIPAKNLWEMRTRAREQLIVYTREKLGRQLAVEGVKGEDLEKASYLFDPNVLTLGFARRFATYKRANMLLQDKARLLRILTNSDRPVQLIIAGKAHPADLPGQAMIREWMDFIWKEGGRSNVVFLSDYDMLLTEELVQGVDLWVNTPRRPYEACGTSGMKVLVNGGLNLSELDGWWAEAYTPQVGFAIGDGKNRGEDPEWDKVEAGELYDILEKEVVPAFYERNQEGIPEKWVDKMRESMATLTPTYSAGRAVKEYTEKYYLPAAKNYLKRKELGSDIVDWKNAVDKNFSEIHFGNISVEKLGEQYSFVAELYLNGTNPNYLQVELYRSGFVQKMRREEDGRYSALVPADCPSADYTPRVVPYFQGVTSPLEEGNILWQK